MDPSANNNQAIRDASRRGHHECVRDLLTHPKVYISANVNEAIRIATYNGHYECVRLLLVNMIGNLSEYTNFVIFLSILIVFLLSDHSPLSVLF
jgi:hypothetical protein